MTRIFFYGDSNTYGYDPRGYMAGRYPASVRWTEKLRKTFSGRCEFEFDGMNGRSIPRSDREILWMEEAVRGFGRADYIAIMLGTNDLFLTAHPDAAGTGARMQALVQKLLLDFSTQEPLRQTGPRLILVVPPLIAPLATEGDPAYTYKIESARLAEEYRKIAFYLGHGIQVINAAAWSIDMAYDQVHFSEEGCLTFAENMTIEIEQLLQKDSLRWKPVQVDHLVQDRWIDFRQVEYRFPDGSTYTPYYNYTRKSFAVVAASDEEGRFICVRQYRHGLGEVCTEFPAGGIEVGEDPLAAAKRELEEETGFTSDDWTHLFTVPTNPTLTDNYAYLFRAKNCRKTGTTHTDDTEFLQQLMLTPAEIEDLIAQGQFQQSDHILTWLMIRENL